jgi:hypothetical protein
MRLKVVSGGSSNFRRRRIVFASIYLIDCALARLIEIMAIIA